MGQITVLVVDDSALQRKTIRGFLEEEGMRVVTARSGPEALARVDEVQPDVVSLDVHMPGMDGLTFLSELMSRRPTPVVMVSSLTQVGAQMTVEALELGAVDFVGKLDGTISLRLDEIRGEIVSKIWTAARARHPLAHNLSARVHRQKDRRQEGPTQGITVDPRPVDLVIVGASTGGPAVLPDILSTLPARFPPVVIAQHLPASFTRYLARRLDSRSQMRVCQLDGIATLLPGHTYLGMGDADLLVSRRDRRLVGRSVPPSPEYRWHPSVNRLVWSALEVLAPNRVIGVLLTGMGDDGAQAMRELADGGGRTIAQSENSAVVWGMPGELVAAGGATAVLEASHIADQLVAWTPRRRGSHGDIGTGTRIEEQPWVSDAQTR